MWNKKHSKEIKPTQEQPQHIHNFVVSQIVKEPLVEQVGSTMDGEFYCKEVIYIICSECGLVIKQQN